MKLLIAVSLCLLLSLNSLNANEIKKRSAESKHWGYRNRDKSLLPSDWYLTHPKCYGKQQSPINIELDTTTYDENLNDIKISSEFKGANTDVNQNEVWTVENNGHSVVLTPKNKEFSFIMTPENQKYKMLQMHFHWRGSEHLVNGHKFSAELHLVHQNINDTNKFAALGFLFKIANEENPKLNPIIDSLADIIQFKSKTEKQTIKLERLLPTKVSKYYRYSGSLTTPACDEVVEHLVIEEPVLTISEEQLIGFQSIQDSHGAPILTNSRPIQELNERIVKRSFAPGLKTKARNYKSASEYSDDRSVAASFCKQSNISLFIILNFIFYLLF